ncbi:tripartite tricarboxylate transporter permease, partial [bacterium]|nr:tripartite tricarboxylate transporter permease [bacterium]
MTPTSLLLMALGTSLGVMVGAVPGLTGAMLIALTLPLTFSMGGESALVLLISMYVGSVSGGMITATLLRMPGTPASIMTTLDGYPMAKQGKPGRALGLGVVASFVGGMISWVFLVALAAPMAAWSTKFGPFEFFALVMMAMVLIASVGGKSLMKGLLAGFLGILATMPGTAPATGQIRWTFGVHAMDDGFKLLPVLIGLFAVNQIIRDIVHLDEPIEKIELKRDGMFLSVKDWLKNLTNLVRSSVIGTWIGILPGIGANVGSVVAYAAARSMSKTPEKFGHGSEEGIVASESANNATVGGA